MGRHATLQREGGREEAWANCNEMDDDLDWRSNSRLEGGI